MLWFLFYWIPFIVLFIISFKSLYDEYKNGEPISIGYILGNLILIIVPTINLSVMIFYLFEKSNEGAVGTFLNKKFQLKK